MQNHISRIEKLSIIATTKGDSSFDYVTTASEHNEAIQALEHLFEQTSIRWQLIDFKEESGYRTFRITMPNTAATDAHSSLSPEQRKRSDELVKEILRDKNKDHLH